MNANPIYACKRGILSLRQLVSPKEGPSVNDDGIRVCVCELEVESVYEVEECRRPPNG
jgi:hypothetical protein